MEEAVSTNNSVRYVMPILLWFYLFIATVVLVNLLIAVRLRPPFRAACLLACHGPLRSSRCRWPHAPELAARPLACY